MESNMAGFVLNASALESVYNQAKDDGFIDLGLSLKTLHTQNCYPIDQSMLFISLFLSIMFSRIYCEVDPW